MRDDTRPGLLLICGIVALFAVGLGLLPSCTRWFAAQKAQVDRVQAFRKDWNRSCLRRGGQIVTNYKGSPSYLCFGPDGRLLSTR